jgi:hypothetical protein
MICCITHNHIDGTDCRRPSSVASLTKHFSLQPCTLFFYLEQSLQMCMVLFLLFVGEHHHQTLSAESSVPEIIKQIIRTETRQANSDFLQNNVGLLRFCCKKQ